MFAGTRPFVGETPVATLQKIQVEPAPKLRLSRPEVPEAIERTIEKALEKRGTADSSPRMKSQRVSGPFSPR